MSEIVSIPLIKIIMFLAALYAPSNTAEIEIHLEEETKVYANDRGIWTSKKAAEDAFTIEGYRLLTPSGFLDLRSELGDLSEHNWSSESILKIGSSIEVLKTKEGLLIFPEGIRTPDEQIRVIYKTAPHTPGARRRVVE